MECPTCHKSFISNVGFNHHITANICINRDKTCKNCKKYFKDKRNYQYHMKHNVCNKAQPTEKIKIVLKSQYNDMTREELIIKLAQTEGECKALKENPQTVNNQINIVVPPAFLEVDNYQQLTKHLPNLLHNALSKHPANFISYLIKETNCNPERPLFNSIKITNKKDPFAQVSDGQKYVYVPKKSIIAQLIENKRSILQDYIDNNGDKYGEKILRRYQNYVDFLDDDKEAHKDLEIEIICMLLNVSEVIGSDDWSKKLLEDLKTAEKTF